MIKVTLITNNPRKTVIVPETKTVKAILEENDINYGNAAVAVDGATLNAGEINMTLADFGIEEKVIISALANKDNAAKAVVAGSACIITSELTPAQVERFKKFKPEALTLTDEDGDPYFALDYDEEGPGSLTEYGAVLGAQVNAEGKGTITVVIDPATEDAAELVYEKMGRPLMNLKQIEEKLLAAVPALDEEEAAIKANIVCM